MNIPLDQLPKLQHVTVTYFPGEEEKLRHFYVETLGFHEKPVPKSVKPLGWIWFFTQGEGVELHCVPDQIRVSEELAHHFCIQVTDLEGLRTRLEKARAPIREARPLPFRPRFFTRDPFDNLIEVVRVEGDYLENNQ